MFGRKAKAQIHSFDREKLEPVVRCSICTGEKVAGFLEKGSTRFQDVMLIRGEGDLRTFCAMYGIEEPPRQIY